MKFISFFLTSDSIIDRCASVFSTFFYLDSVYEVFCFVKSFKFDLSVEMPLEPKSCFI